MTYTMILEFDTDSPDFRRGMEVGIVWANLGREDGERSFMVHGDTTEMLMRAAEAKGLEYSARLHENDWVEVTFS